MNHQDKKHFLKNLKVGDKVFLSIGYEMPCGKIQTIARITKTMFITECKSRYKRETGFSVGDGFYKNYIAGYPTVKDFEKVKRHQLIERLSNSNYENLSTATLQKISDLMNTPS